MKDEQESLIYRIKGQDKNNKITISAETHNGMTFEEAVKAANESVFVSPQEQYSKFVIEPICTPAEWKRGTVNFCPRCGKALEEPLENGGDWDCFECDAHVEAYVLRAD